jgi:integrase
MRVEATKGNEHKVWLTDSEIEDLRRATNSQRDDLIIQLGAFVGLRAFEIPQVRPADVKETDSGQYRLPVQAGKDTTGNGGKPRDAYLPDGVERDLQRYQNEHNIAPRDPVIDLK